MGGRVQNNERKASESRRRNEAESLKKDNRDKAIRVQKKRSQKSWISENYSYVLVAAGVLAFFIFLRMEPRGTTENLDSAEAPAIEDMYISDHNEGNSGYNLGSNTLFDGVSLAESRKIFKNYFNQHVLSCEKKTSKGCDAGYLIGALEYGRTRGFVHAECMPYKPYDIAVDCNMAEINKCFQKEKVKDYCSVTGTADIKREIMENGPVVSLFPAYRDFLIYKDGVFQPTGDAARVDGHQALKVIGWNTSGKTHYWIAENSFGSSWGESGIVKIAMNVQDSSLDKTAIAINVDYNEEAQE